MARIRSVHPSLFTDERWVSCSPMARVLYIGLLTEADDQGLFEWKPVQIKIRLLPVDNADVPALLEELAGVDLIARVESAGKQLGAVRKFLRFQRPKKPNHQFIMPPEFRTYVGLDDPSSELGDDEAPSVPPKGEQVEQKEDGGDKKEAPQTPQVGSEPPPSVEKPKPPDEARLAFDLWNETARRCGLPVAKSLDDARRRSIGQRLDEAGLEGWREALEAVERSAFLRGQRPGRDGRPMKADLGFVCQAKTYPRLREGFYGDDATEPKPAVVAIDPELQRWRTRVREFTKNRWWEETNWGPRPGKPGCLAPTEILAEFGFATEVAA